MSRQDSRRRDVRGKGRKPGRRAHQLRPEMTRLEDRALLASFVVSSINDAGTGTLRAAITSANGDSSNDTITFSSLFNTAKTITLTSGQLELSKTQGTLTITGPGANLLSVSGNNASRVFQVDTNVTAEIDGLTVTGGNAGAGSGGGITSRGKLTLNGDAISSNTAGSTGGGIFIDVATNGTSSLTVLNSTINSNTASFGGGIAGTAGSGNANVSTSITNSTVTGNTASSSTIGSGILIQASGTGSTDSLSLIDSTVTANNQGGLFAQANTGTTVPFFAQGSILARNSNADITNSNATVNSGSNYNLVGDGTGGLPTAAVNHNLLGTSSSHLDPKLGTLGNHGGTTQTFPLLTGSPALGAGVVVSGVTADQRGMPRKATPDIGSYESRSAVVTVTDTGGTYNGSPFAATATVAGLLTGVDTTPGSTLQGVGLTLDYVNTGTNADLGATPPTNAGNYRVTASFAGSTSYAAASASATFSIAQAPLTLAADTLSKAVGASDPALTYTITGGTLIGGDSLSGALSRDPGTTVGSYNINQGTLTAGGNYSLSYTGGVLYITSVSTSITKAQTVAVASAGGTSTATTSAGPSDTAPRVTAAGSGFDGLLTAARFASSPASASDPAASAYFDVRATGNNLGSGEVDLSFTNQTPNRSVLYFDGSHWQYSTDASGARVKTDATGSATLKVTTASVPAITKLSGQYFEVAPTEADGLVVNTTQDVIDPTDNVTSLREAIAYAKGLGGAQTVTFDLGTTPRTITLTSGPIDLTDPFTGAGDSLTIQGPGAGLLTVSGGGVSRVFALHGGSASLAGLTVAGGRATTGAGLLADAGSLTLTDCTVSGNTAQGSGGTLPPEASGGGIVVTGSAALALTDCTISGNTVQGGSGFGGGLTFGGGIEANSSGPVTLTGCTVSGNTAQGGGGSFSGASGTGGGVDDRGSGTLTLTDCTVTGNAALGGNGPTYGGAAIGGGVAASGSGPVTLTGCTVSGNTVSNGGGPRNGGTSGGGIAASNSMVVVLTDTIVADPVSGTLAASSAFNLLVGASPVAGLANGNNGNIVVPTATALKLGTLGGYGGATQTITLLPGSPAIDAGSATLPTDQRGEARVGAQDIGAFESQGFTIAVTGGNNQSTPINTPFALPLTATITANNPAEPVNGGAITFAAVPSPAGASASLSATTVTIANGTAIVTANANANGGSYQVNASATGANTVAFSLQNQFQVSVVSGLAPLTITYGTSVSFGGSLTTVDGTPIVGGTVVVTISASGNILLSRAAVTDATGAFTLGLPTDSLPAAPSSPYLVSYAYQGNSSIQGASDSSTLTVNQATANLQVKGYGVTYDATARTATGTATGAGGANLAADLDLSGTTHTAAGTYANDAWTFHDPSGNYADASGTVTDHITLRDLYLTAAPNSKTYGQAASDTGTLVGVQGTDGITATYISTGDAASAPVGTGSYAIIATLSDPNLRLSNYLVHETDATLSVNQATPIVSVGPVSVTYGTALGNGQLSGSATWTVGGSPVNVPGTFTYTSAAGTVLNAGNNPTEDVTFTPNDTNDYTTASITVAVNVSQAIPTVSVNPVNITYGTLLSNDQLSGTATWTVNGSTVAVTGSFFTVGNGALLDPGSSNVPVTFAPDDTTDYAIASTQAVYHVSAATPIVSVDPVSITYGTPLSNDQLTGSATWTIGSSPVTVAGVFTYTTAAGAVLSAGGGKTESVTFTPNDATHYLSAPTTVVVNVARSTPAVSVNPVSIPYGTSLSDGLLSGTATQVVSGAQVVVPGTYHFTTAGGLILDAGSGQAESVTFTPNDTNNDQAVTTAVVVNVDKTTPVINWANPAAITYGTPLAAAQLNATVTGSGPAAVGALTYSPPVGTVLTFGMHQALTVSMAATNDYNAAAATVSIDVNQATPILSVNPVSIIYGTPLSNGQLTGSATWTVNGNSVNVPGTFTYTTAAGAVLNAGGGQIENVTFTPNDTTDYATVGSTATVNVAKATLTVTATSRHKTYGQALAPSNYTGTLMGVLPGDNITATFDSLTGDPATATVTGGPYAIVPTLNDPGGRLANYNVSTTNGQLVVDTKALTVTANSLTKLFGQTLTFAGTEFTTSGPINHDMVNSVTLSSLGTAAGATVVGSPYAITIGSAVGVGLGNYSILYVNGTLSVTLPSKSAYILDPTAHGAVSASGNATLVLPGGLYVDSNATDAVTASGNATVNVGKTLQVVGGVKVSGNASATKTGTPGSTANPYGVLPLPGVTGLTSYGAAKVAGNGKSTLNPGIYTSIQVSGNGVATLQPGVYVIKGGGLSVSGNGSLSGRGVTIVNVGSAYNGTTDGGNFGSVSIGGNGTVTLSGPTSGPYAGVVIDQPATNGKALTLSGNTEVGITSLIDAPAAAVGLSGNARLSGSLICDTLSLSGNAGASQPSCNAESDCGPSTCDWISKGVLTVSVQDDTGTRLDPQAVARLGDAMAYLNQALGGFGVSLSWAPAGTPANVRIHFAATTPEGGAAQGVLAFTTASNDVYFASGWNESMAADPAQVGPNQYDFQTLAIHELAHTVGLGESADPSSVMYEYLTPGTVRRTFSDANLPPINTNADRFMKAEGSPTAPASPVGVVAGPMMWGPLAPLSAVADGSPFEGVNRQSRALRGAGRQAIASVPLAVATAMAVGLRAKALITGTEPSAVDRVAAPLDPIAALPREQAMDREQAVSDLAAGRVGGV